MIRHFFLASILFLSVHLQAQKTILVQGAMDMEVETLVAALKNPKKEKIGTYSYWIGDIGNNKVIVSRTEIGMVNAAISTTIAVNKYNPQIIINQGTSGGHNPDLHAYDIVLAEKTVNFASSKTISRPYGEVTQPDLWEFEINAQTLRNHADSLVGYDFFYSDSLLLSIAQKIPYAYQLHTGVIASGDQWNRELERIKHIRSKFNSDVEEMETSAVAQVAKVFGIPFLGVRILSNNEIHGEVFDEKTAVKCQEFVIDLLKKI